MTSLTIETAEVFEPLLYPARYKGAHGGRASGKSHFFGDLWLDENIRMKLDCVCLREIQKSLEFSVKKLLEQKIETYNAGAYFEVQDARILTQSGGVTIFQGMQNHTAESIKSLEAFDRAWFTEAQRATQKSLDLLRPTLRKETSELWFDWNPNDPTDPIDVLLRGDRPPPGAIVVEANYLQNPWLPKVMETEIEYDRSRDPDKFSHIWMGEYQSSSEARIFKNWKIEEFERPEGTIYRLGADWGYSIDPSVLVRASIEGNRLYVDHEAYLIGCEIVNLPDLFDRVPESRKWFIRADSARPETISYMQKNGYPKMQSAQKGKGSIEEGIAFLQSFDIVVHPRCVHLIDELKTYSYKRDSLTDEILPLIEDKNNHVIDALRYACEGVRKAKPIRRSVDLPPRQQYHDHSQARTGWMRA